MDFSDRKKKIYVQCFDPWLEIKLHVEDLNESYGVTYDSVESYSHWGTTVRAIPKRRDGSIDTSAPMLIVGAYISVSVCGYVGFRSSSRSDRWKFKVHTISNTLPESKSWKSTMDAYNNRRN